MKQLYFSVLFTGLGLSAAAQWTITQDMFETRTQHVAVALNAGRVLAAGGYDFTNNLVTAEVYDKGTDSWTPTSNDMTSAHTTGAAVLLSNGKVLVISGWDGSINTTTCDMYDPTTDTWTVAGSMAYGRSYHTATLLNDGRVLVVGGYTGATNTPVCEIYDPALGTWSQTDSLAIGRSYHTATLMSDGRVLVAGGYNPAEGFQLYSVEIFDPVTNTWSTANSMADPRAWHSASLLDDGSVMVAGGEYFTGGSPFAYEGLNSAEAFDPATGNWSALADMPGGLSYNQQFTIIGGSVIVVAGLANTDYGSGFTSSPGVTYKYNVVANTWSNLAMNVDGRTQYAAAQLSNFEVLVCGGDDNTAEMYVMFTGIDEIDVPSMVQVYPNPSNGVFTVASKNNQSISSIKIFDLSGKQVFLGTDIRAQNTTVDLSGLSEGLYTMQLDTDAGKAVSRISIVK